MDLMSNQFSEMINTTLEQVQEVNDQKDVGELSERFEQAMMTPHGSEGIEGGLIESISEMKNTIDSAKIELHETLKIAGNDPAMLMQTQFDLMRVTFQQELIAKTVGKTTQNAETILKAQ